MADKKLKILYIEDSTSDLELVDRELKSSSLNYELKYVDTEEEFAVALNDYNPDVILSDHSLPSFNSNKALKMVKLSKPEVPFILITGAVSEEYAVSIMKEGADDYILKDRLQRLPSAINNAVKTKHLERERQKHIDAIVEKENIMKEAEKIAHFGSWQYDFSQRVLKWSDEVYRILGYKPGEVEPSQESFLSQIHEDDRAFIKISLDDAIRNRRSVEFDFRVINKAGDLRVYNNKLILMKNKNNEPLAAIGFMHDITEMTKIIDELRLAKDKAEEMNKLKSIFLSNMSHELRTPMVGILGFAELLMDEIKNKRQLAMISTIHSSSQRLLKTLNLILDLSYIESNRKALNFSFVDVDLVVNRAVDLFTGVASQKKLKLEKEIITPRIFAWLDERVFEQVLNNLLSNAVKFTNTGSIKLTVDTSADNNNKQLKIVVSDTGIGILPEYQGMIFDEFRQVSEGLTRDYEGTGLGLTITKKFVVLLKGKIEVQSFPNSGSVFTVTLPLLSPGASHKADNSHYNNDDVDLKVPPGKRLLVVDDDKNSHDIVTMILRNKFEVDSVETAEAAIKACEEIKYDAVLLDITLHRDFDGVDVMKKIRKIPGYKDSPIAAFTAFNMKGDKERFLAHGFDNFLSKPFTKSELFGLLNELFAGRE